MKQAPRATYTQPYLRHHVQLLIIATATISPHKLNSSIVIMATQFVKWWRTKFHHQHEHQHNNIRASSRSGSSATSSSEAGCCSSGGSSSSDILLLASRGRGKCRSRRECKTVSAVLGSSSTTTSVDDRHSDTEDLVLRDDTSSVYNRHGGGHVNGGMISSSDSDSSDLSRGHTVGHCSGGGATVVHHGKEHFHRGGCCGKNLTNSASRNCDEDEDHVDMKFEDFECDLHLDAGPEEQDAPTIIDADKREFSFTFYDLDGHGKITKDDIAGLVRSIYGAVNDSITVPQGGKKTIRVRLTVAPEQANNRINNNISEDDPPSTLLADSPEDNTLQESPTELRNNANLLRNHRGSKVRFSASPGKKRSNLDRFLKYGAKCEECSADAAPAATPPKHHQRRRWRKSVDAGCCHPSTLLAKPHLFELLQANMEKNNVSPCCRLDYSKLELQNNYVHHSVQSSPVHCTHNKVLDPKCPILPLLNNNTHLNNVSSPGSGGRKSVGGRHHRSRSHDEQGGYQLLAQSNNVNRCSARDELAGCCLQAKNNNLSAAAHHNHQLKHRNREQEHQRAMAQVISWLEREDLGMGGRPQTRRHDKCASPPAAVKKYHHHIHEHVHHHYHHHYAGRVGKAAAEGKVVV